MKGTQQGFLWWVGVDGGGSLLEPLPCAPESARGEAVCNPAASCAGEGTKTLAGVPVNPRGSESPSCVREVGPVSGAVFERYKGQALPEVKVLLVRETPAQCVRVREPAGVLELWRSTVETRPEWDPEKECFVVFLVDAKNRCKGMHVVSVGLLDASLVHPRECFRAAVAGAAAAVILAHHHPSGDTAPSAEDIRITRQMVEAGKVLDIQVLDHVIVGAGERPVLSMRGEGLCSFSA